MTVLRRAAGASLRFLPFSALFWAATASAAIPADYKGTPYMGTAQVIPGRVELANLDEGGKDVAFYADHRRENAVAEGYAPISGDDYRPGNLNLPNICKTNRAVEKPGEGSEDFWEDGKRYPSDDNMYVYYMGYAHTVDWVRVTVNVQVAGKYNVSSNWACANPKCGLSLWFNDGSGKSDNAQRPLDGENKSGIVMLDGTNDYHKWRAYPNFTQVELTAGLQVMTFNLEVADHLQYGFLQFDLVGGNPQGGAGGSGGAAGGTASGGVGGVGGVGGMPGGGETSAAGTLNGVPSAGGDVTMGGSSATGGSTPTTTSGGSGAGTTAMFGAGAASGSDSGCSLGSHSSSSGTAFAALGLGAALMLWQRRKRA
ncbi:MAG TPA: hypothetical protein VHB79_34385 [Polyangiaceae bacterium]|nr:hypothetical protein [Polyangiaceae bacterium]